MAAAHALSRGRGHHGPGGRRAAGRWWCPRSAASPCSSTRRGSTRAAGELSFVCVPIKADARPVGALGVTLPFEQDRTLRAGAEVLRDRGLDARPGGASPQAHGGGAPQRLLDENTKLRQELQQRYDIRNIVGTSRAMQQVYEQVAQVAPASTTVLLRGESGTGKELVAHALHYSSPRAKKPFVKVSCGALPESLIESELFGYEPGAFTDARAQKKGRFELAQRGHPLPGRGGRAEPRHPGEAAAGPAGAGVRAARGASPIKVNVRLVAATNKDLEAAVQDGTLPRRPLLPSERLQHLPAPPARAQARHPAPGRPFHREVRGRRRARTCAASPPPPSTC